MSIADLQIFSTRLKEARTDRGLTLKDLAEKINVSFSAIANYESGSNGPKPSTLLKLSEALGVNKLWLAGDIDDPSQASPNRIQTSSARRRVTAHEGSEVAALDLHPKIQAQAEEIMDREGFTTMKELFTWLVKEESRRADNADRAVEVNPVSDALEKHAEALRQHQALLEIKINEINCRHR